MDIQARVSMNVDDLRAWSSAKDEPRWLIERRVHALELEGTLELPKVEKINLEKWDIYESGDYKAENAWSSLEEAPEVVRGLVASPVKGGLIVQFNSDVVYTKLSESLAAQGVILTDLHTAAKEHEELVQRYLFQAVKPEEHRLSAAHSALWSGGVFLYVPDGVEVEAPIQAIFLNDTSGVCFAPHVLIVAGSNSKITYVDNCVSSGDDVKVLHNGVTEVFAGRAQRCK